MRIKDLDQSDELKNFLLDFANNLQGFLLLSGKNGTGKSTAAMAVYEFVSPFKLPAYDHDIAYFANQADLNFHWQKEFNDYGTALGILKVVTETKLLILDDLGTRIPSDSFMDFLYKIADERYLNRHSRATIITTNLNMTDMRQKFGDAFVSRVASGQCFRLEGNDRRFEYDKF